MKSYYEEITNGLLSWLLRSKMSFYGVELNLPWWFGLSSWNYAVGGLFMLMIVDTKKWSGISIFPYTMFALYLAMIQAPLSFCADYLYMSEDSVFHILDRVSAVFIASIEGVRILSHYLNNDTVYAKNALFTALACLLCYIQSNKSQSMLDRDGFVLWHSLWHMYPILSVITTTFTENIAVKTDLFFFKKFMIVNKKASSTKRRKIKQEGEKRRRKKKSKKMGLLPFIFSSSRLKIA